MKPIHLRKLFLIFALMLLSGCREQQVDDGSIITVYVAPTTIPCPDSADQSCLLVAEGILINWQVRQKEIQAFDFQPGFFYTLVVRESGRREPKDWTLEEIVTQEPAHIRNVIIGPERVACAGAASQMCLVYKKNLTDNWQFLTQEIGGFTHETGLAYELTILERSNNLAENGPPTWTLMQEVRREPMSITDIQIVAAPTEDPVTPTPEDAIWQEVQLPSLGIRTVLPQYWQPLGNNEADVQAWGDGAVSFVNFSTVPGFDGRAILAQMVGTGTQLNLPPEQVSEATIGERNWLIYAQNNGGTTLSAAVTVENGTAVIISLYTNANEQETLLQTILENFSFQQP